jgi:pimeloyl-ACP methyl ester carboxylesterase
MRYGDLAADSIGTDDGRPALVLLHGLTFNRQHWAPVLADPAIAYAARYPVRGVVNIDQPLRAGGFGEFLRRPEPVLNSDDFLKVWDTLLGGMHLDELPPPAQELVRTVSTPRQDLFLGYWKELIDAPEQADEDNSRDLAAIRAVGVPYHYIAGSAVEPGYRAWLEAALPDVLITELPGSGHFPHLVHPAEIAKALAHFAVPAR